jgi:predicted LPLAT superfamily acyltransferase
MAEAASHAKHWADYGERGAAWGPATIAFVYRLLGRTACLVFMAPVILYFYAAGAGQRRASLDYLARVWRANGWTPAPGHWQGLKHFFSFGAATLDKFAAWIGRVGRSDIDGIDGALFQQMRSDPRGAMLLSGHVGTTDIIRAIATREQKRPVNVIVHTAHAEKYNRLIARFAPESSVRLIQASEVGLGTALHLSAAIERGEWIVIMGDRVSVRHQERTIEVNFLGAPALLPQGPFLLATLLRCPVYMLFCVEKDRRKRVHFSLLTEAAGAPREARTERLQDLAQRYAAVLEDIVRSAPYQWFNFYDYWARPLAGTGR